MKKLSFEELSAMRCGVSYFVNGQKKDGTRGLICHTYYKITKEEREELQKYSNVELSSCSPRFAPENVIDVVFLKGVRL